MVSGRGLLQSLQKTSALEALGITKSPPEVFSKGPLHWPCNIVAYSKWKNCEDTFWIWCAPLFQAVGLWKALVIKFTALDAACLDRCSPPGTIPEDAQSAVRRADITQVEVLVCRVFAKSSRPMARANSYLDKAAQDMEVPDVRPLVSEHVQSLLNTA